MYVKTWRMKESVCIQLSAVLQLQISFTFKSVNFCESDVQDNVIQKSYTCSALLEDKYINFIDTCFFIL